MYLCCCPLLGTGDLKSSLSLQLVSGGCIGGVIPEEYLCLIISTISGGPSLEHFYCGPDPSPASQKKDSIFPPNLNISDLILYDLHSTVPNITIPSFLKCTLLSLWVQTGHQTGSRNCLAWLMAYLSVLATLEPHHPFPTLFLPHLQAGVTGQNQRLLLPPPTMAIALLLSRASTGISACLCWALLLLAGTCLAKSWPRSSHLQPYVSNFLHAGP